MTQELTFKEKLAVKIIRETLAYELQGLANEVHDGERTEEDFRKHVVLNDMIDDATSLLNNSMKNDTMLVSPQSDLAVEPKHLKFLGTERLDYLKTFAAFKVFAEFSRYNF